MIGQRDGGPLIWRIDARHDGLTLSPPGVSLPAIEFPADSREAALLLQRWENASGLVDCFTHGEEAYWWACQRHLFTIRLALLLVALRALKPVLAQLGQSPTQINLSAPPAQAAALAGAVAVLCPGVPIAQTANAGLRPRDYLRWYLFLAVGRIRAASGRRRLDRVPARTAARRILIVQSELQWVGRRDKEMGSTAEALRAAGAEVITIATPSEYLKKNSVGLVRRPKDHVFADFVRRSARPFMPSAVPTYAPGRFSHDGHDLTGFVREWMESAAPRDDLRTSDAEWTRLIERLAPDVILMAHEHYDRAVIGRAAREAGIKIGVIQHGILAEYSALYVFPPRAAASFPLPWRIFVYTQRDAEILSRLSIFPRDSIVVTGSTEWDAFRAQGETRRCAAQIASGGRGPVRAAHGRRIRLLFTSQHGLDEAIIRALLEGVSSLGGAAELRVRPHPREVALWRWQRAFAAFPSVAASLGRPIPLEDDLAWCDLHITFASTCVMHAIVAGIPSLLLGENEYPWREQFVDAGLAKKVGAARTFTEGIREWSAPEARAAFFADRERYLLSSGAGAEAAGGRIASEVAVI